MGLITPNQPAKTIKFLFSPDLSRAKLIAVTRPSRHPARPAALASALLDWFETNARDLPWRRTSDPYAIWVSEIMLQQTQVKTVVPYWLRWMEALPTVEALAAAPAALIHKLWEGLGYYSRVRNMQKAAQIIVSRHGGIFPEKFSDLLDLPGVGRYTAGAVGSIAFNQPLPILDGNVVRVLTRLFCLEGDPAQAALRDSLWKMAAELVSAAATTAWPRAASHFNQALMELGALICTPREARCPACPLRGSCRAARDRRVAEFPQIPPRPKSTPRYFAAWVAVHRNKWLVRQRPAGSVNAELWEFPNIETMRPGARPPGAQAGEPLGRIKHSITRYRITLDSFLLREKIDAPDGAVWLPLTQVEQLAFTSAHRKILRQARDRLAASKPV